MDQYLLRTEGLYSYISDHDEHLLKTNTVFRFYPDGRVISAVIGQTFHDEDIFPQKNWFDIDHDYEYSTGTWEVSGSNIDICIEIPEGRIIYKGEIIKDRLILDSYSEVTGHEEKDRDFLFIPFDKIPGWSDTAEK